MVKGVSKQIVEINCTQDEYIEKAILIMNPQKGRLPQGVMDERARDFLKNLLPPPNKPASYPQLRVLRHPLFWILTLGGTALITVSLLLLFLL